MNDSRSNAMAETAIAEELLRIHEESYGASAARAQAIVGEDAVIVFLDDLELQQSEEFLIGAGEAQAVIDVRGRYQQAIETTFRAVVERATGRRVISFVSATKLNPNYAVEVFRLAPVATDNPGDGLPPADEANGSRLDGGS